MLRAQKAVEHPKREVSRSESRKEHSKPWYFLSEATNIAFRYMISITHPPFVATLSRYSSLLTTLNRPQQWGHAQAPVGLEVRPTSNVQGTCSIRSMLSPNYWEHWVCTFRLFYLVATMALFSFRISAGAIPAHHTYLSYSSAYFGRKAVASGACSVFLRWTVMMELASSFPLPWAVACLNLMLLNKVYPVSLKNVSFFPETVNLWYILPLCYPTHPLPS